MGIEEKFYKLLQMSVGSAVVQELPLKDEEWRIIYNLACKQSLVGLLVGALNQLSKIGQKPPTNILYEWIGQSEIIRQSNHKLNQQSEQLTNWFKSRGYDSCVLKGQGVARLYLNPESRQPGDIDIWVDGSRDGIVKLMCSNFIGVTFVDYVNCHALFFTDTEVEVHFRPTWFYNPIVNRKVQRWIRESKAVQMTHNDTEARFNYPTIEFNLVFSLIHIFRHVLFEGIGLRQLTDYYFILQHSTGEERQRAFSVLRSFGVGKFVGTVMYIMRRVYGMEQSMLMCEPDEEQGEILLGEILRGGNFGHHDDRIKRVDDQQRWKRGWENFKRDMKFMKAYPSEVLWLPVWKTWHYFWRMYKGYLD